MSIPGVSAAPGGDPLGVRTPRRSPVRLALLDDHEVLLDSLSSWIAGNAPDFDVVLAATSWLQLVHSPAFPTEMVFLDLQLAEPVSIEARVRTCRAAGAKVVVLTSLDTPEARERAMAAGAAEFLAKTLPMAEVMEAARRVMGLDDAGTAGGWRPPPSGAAAHPEHVRPRLSPGEEEALKLYVAGHSTAEVAAEMNVQYETAKTYLRRVREKYAKVGRPAGKKAELIRRAAEDGILE
ncbi:response regulator transcription factor [Schumannella luteola]|uniref:DNA-binding NarL/FixJ family response regulator n=1 Tax=Schumannella luteola TaxID=472059 RepID=A0A852Y6P1_9MICO|nr:response regulator transcription factor [Schumannella luteola]NYG98626.1 DNA-binding NarL/FixJ family response regulator [Schumannella luteola]TPX02597.1 response regulator transcription factor [Schumannella luteola]